MKMKSIQKIIFLSGIQPTGVPHIGNYFGAISKWIEIQEESPSTTLLTSVVDLHALTLPQNPADLRRNTLEMGMSLMAAGLDPKKSILFRQSKVHQHAELAWILFCKTPVSWLSKMHQWKSKCASTNSADSLEGDIGLLSYPVLQAADILLYNATHVPVGEDQSQHINLTSDIAKRFNSTYKQPLFTIPQGMYPSATSKRIMSLTNPMKKMSKSELLDRSRINLTDSPDQIAAKIKKATVDSSVGIEYNPKERPGIANLLHIIMAIQDLESSLAAAAASSKSKSTSLESWSRLEYSQVNQKVQELYGGMNNSQFKSLVADTIIQHLKPFLRRYEEYRQDPTPVLEAFERGERIASGMAAGTLERVYTCIGLCQPRDHL